MMPFANKFFYQYQYSISELPQNVRTELEMEYAMKKDKQVLQYSENMIVFTGAKGVQIFDADLEKWIWSGTDNCHKNEYLTKKMENENVFNQMMN